MATLLLPSHCSVIAYTDGYALCLQSVIQKAWLCWETGNSHQNICRDWVDDTPQKKFYIMKKVDCIIFAWRLIYGWWHQKRIAWYSEKKMETVSSPRLIYIPFLNLIAGCAISPAIMIYLIRDILSSSIL